VFCDIATLRIKIYDWQLKIKTGVHKFWGQITLAIQFCAMTRNIHRPSVWNLFPVTLVAPGILRRLLCLFFGGGGSIGLSLNTHKDLRI
jgi:hypothetical protein